MSRYAEGQIWRTANGQRRVEIDMIKDGSVYYRVGAADGGLIDAARMSEYVFDAAVRGAGMSLEVES